MNFIIFFAIMIPVRCFSCGKVIAHLYAKYQSAIKEGQTPENVLKSMKITKTCCRRHFITTVDHVDMLIDLKAMMK